jgi:hypothetical protein
MLSSGCATRLVPFCDWLIVCVAKCSAMVHILCDIVLLLEGVVINFVADSHQKLYTSSPYTLEQCLPLPFTVQLDTVMAGFNH